jgi:asparagine synthase (glutamine-hydrolysing)
MAGILREARKPYITQELYGCKKQLYMGPNKWRFDGPVHIKMKEICTKAAVEKLVFVDWEVVRGAFKVGQGL